MKTEFEIFGRFYVHSGLKCRKYLDLKRHGVNLNHPDIMVVMMNPGSSYPLDRIDDNQVESKAYPDPTQDQIMAVMNNTGLNYARVLNLSDVRQSSSGEFYKFIKSEDSRAIPHSIFHQSRADELSTLFRQNAPVIYGWGVNSSLEVLARMAMNRLLATDPIGINKNGFEWAYYHPLPRIHTKQVEWVKVISSKLLNA